MYLTRAVADRADAARSLFFDGTLGAGLYRYLPDCTGFQKKKTKIPFPFSSCDAPKIEETLGVIGGAFRWPSGARLFRSFNHLFSALREPL